MFSSPKRFNIAADLALKFSYWLVSFIKWVLHSSFIRRPLKLAVESIQVTTRLCESSDKHIHAVSLQTLAILLLSVHWGAREQPHRGALWVSA